MRKLLLSIVLAATTIAIYAQHGTHSEDSHKDVHHDSHAHKHHLAIFNGTATSFTHHFTAYSLGVDYEYRLTGFLGLGLLAEAVFAESQELIAGLPVFLHPFGNFKALIAPMVLFSEAHDGGQEETHKKAATTELGKEAHFGFRAGIAYDFHLGKLSLGPVVNYDYANGASTIVYGVNLGFGF
jgi:hypothetical protein